MKKLISFLLIFAFVFSLCACGKGEEEPQAQMPPGFSVLQNQMKLSKHNKSGENATFSKEEFMSFLGEDFGSVTVTQLPPDGVLVCNGSAVLKGQTISAENLGFLKFVPNTDCVASAFEFTCDSKSFNGKAMICELAFSDSANLSPLAENGEISTVSGISVYGNLNVDEPDGDDFTIDVITYPSNGFVTVNSDGTIIYTPEEGFSGKDKLVYSVTDYFGAVSSVATLDIAVKENSKNLVFADMENDPDHLYAHRMCVNDVMVYRLEDGNYYFDPDEYVSKMDFLVMLMCATNLDDGITAVADSIVTDDATLSSGLKGFLSAANEQGLIKLENGKFLPKENITFEDAAFMSAKVLGLPEGNDALEQEVVGELMASVTVKTEETENEFNKELTKSDVAKILCRIEDYMIDNNIQNNQ